MTSFEPQGAVDRRPRITARAPFDRLRARLADLDGPSALLVERLLRQPIGAPMPPTPPGAARLLTLNIAHGRRRVPHQALVHRRRLHRNLARVASALDELSPDIVALQEADGPSPWSGNFDHVATLAAHARLDQHYRGDHNPFRVGGRALASGTALLARWPLLEPCSHRFDSSWRCTKGFVVATVEVPAWDARAIDVVSVHLDFLAPHLRRRQIQRMGDVLADRGRPLVVLGDLNCCWRREPESMALLSRRLRLRAFEPEGHKPTYPAYRPRRRLDWILVSDQLRFAGHRRVPVKLSDHLGVVADLRWRD